jgi:hypothetical protein
MSDDFGDLSREFQGIRAPSTDLVKAVERGRRKLLVGLVAGVATGVLTSSAGIFVLWRDHDAPAVVFAAMQIGVPIAVLAFVSYSQRHAWRARSETTRGFLELELERRRDRIRQGRFLRWLLIPLVAMVVIFHALVVRKLPGMLAWHPAAVVGLGGPYAIAAGLLGYSLLRTARLRREEAELTRKLAALDDV